VTGGKARAWTSPTCFTASHATRCHSACSRIKLYSMASNVTASTVSLTRTIPSLEALPDELLLQIMSDLDYPFLLALSRVSHRLRSVSLDHVLYLHRLHMSSVHLLSFLPQRPSLRSIQPPASAIYLTRTHVAARNLHFRLLSATLNRSLSRRPTVSSLVNARILPKDCCRRDRSSGEIIVTHSGLYERKRKLELEKFKEGMRIWLEKKARAISRRKSIVGGVGILVWRFTKRSKGPDDLPTEPSSHACSENYHVSSLRRFWEDIGSKGISARSR
ncbi:unnamed protein product, partial [Aureobasidium uvarum]